MLSVNKNFLENHNLQIAGIEKKSGISFNKIKLALNKDVSLWKVQILEALADSASLSLEETFNILKGKEYQFLLDDENMTIQGVKFDDPMKYFAVRNSVLSGVYEGWQPTKEDILKLANPTEDEVEEFRKDVENILREKNGK